MSRVLPPPRRGRRVEPPLRPAGLPPVPVRGPRRAGRDGAPGASSGSPRSGWPRFLAVLKRFGPGDPGRSRSRRRAGPWPSTSRSATPASAACSTPSTTRWSRPAAASTWPRTRGWHRPPSAPMYPRLDEWRAVQGPGRSRRGPALRPRAPARPRATTSSIRCRCRGRRSEGPPHRHPGPVGTAPAKACFQGQRPRPRQNGSHHDRRRRATPVRPRARGILRARPGPSWPGWSRTGAAPWCWPGGRGPGCRPRPTRPGRPEPRSSSRLPFDAADTGQPCRPSPIEVFDRFGDIDLVIVAAGVLGDQEADEQDPAAAAAVITTNFTGTASAMLAVADRLRLQGHGRLIVLSSVAGERARQGQLHLRVVQGRARRLRPGPGRFAGRLRGRRDHRPPGIRGRADDRGHDPGAVLHHARGGGRRRGARASGPVPPWSTSRRCSDGSSPSCATCPGPSGAACPG